MAQTSDPLLELVLASLEVIRRWHIQNVSIMVFAEETNKLRVNKTTIDCDLVLDEFDESVPDFQCFGSVLCHQSL